MNYVTLTFSETLDPKLTSPVTVKWSNSSRSGMVSKRLRKSSTWKYNELLVHPSSKNAFGLSTIMWLKMHDWNSCVHDYTTNPCKLLIAKLDKRSGVECPRRVHGQASVLQKVQIRHHLHTRVKFVKNSMNGPNNQQIRRLFDRKETWSRNVDP
jgi:hypothetical protein